MTKLRARFENFVQTLNGFENIDDLLKAIPTRGKKRADYLFDSRRIIVEQKSLEANPVGRPQNFTKRVIKERGVVVFGTVSTRQIFASQPDTQSLQRAMVLDLAKTIDADVALADKQTRDTREIFGIAEAPGVIVFLNEKAHMLKPDVIRYALANVFNKKKLDGSPRYPNNDAVIVISEAHQADMPGAIRAFPITSFVTPWQRDPARFGAFQDVLFPAWAAYNGAPMIAAAGDDLSMFRDRTD